MWEYAVLYVDQAGVGGELHFSHDQDPEVSTRFRADARRSSTRKLFFDKQSFHMMDTLGQLGDENWELVVGEHIANSFGKLIFMRPSA